MQKQAPTVGRVLVMVGFALSCFGLLLFLWLAFGGTIPLAPKGYRFHVDFPEATSLAKQADVRISGVPVGKVSDLAVGPGDTTDATIQLEPRYAPIAEDARAILRQKTLLGETYVELTPGTKGRDHALPEGGTLRGGRVAQTVQLDEIFRSFDPRTRAAFRTWMQSQAGAVSGRGRDINDALGNLAPFAEDTNHLVEILNSQQGAVHQLVRNTGTVFGALTARDGELRSLIRNSNRVFAATARSQRGLRQTFTVLPTFERESAATLDRLTRFTQNADPLVTRLRPAARELGPTFTDLRGIAPDLKALFVDLRPLIRVSRLGLPALEHFLDDLRPVLGQLDPFLRNLNPMLRFIGLYKRELNAFFANVVAATEATEFPLKSKVPVHYLRTANPVNPENLAVYPRRLGSNRPNPYVLPGGFDRLGKPALRVYENRQCGRGDLAPPSRAPDLPLPPLPGPLGGVVRGVLGQVPGLTDRINTLIFARVGGNVPAPPCIKQGRYPAPYRTDYPQVKADR